MAARTRYKGLLIALAGTAVFILSLVALGCKSGSSGTTKPMSSQTQSSAKVATNGGPPDIDLNCVIDHLQNPPESFHYIFKAESDNPWAEEADVTPQVINLSFKSNYMPAPVAAGNATPVSVGHRANGQHLRTRAQYIGGG